MTTATPWRCRHRSRREDSYDTPGEVARETARSRAFQDTWGSGLGSVACGVACRWVRRSRNSRLPCVSRRSALQACSTPHFAKVGAGQPFRQPIRERATDRATVGDLRFPGMRTLLRCFGRCDECCLHLARPFQHPAVDLVPRLPQLAALLFTLPALLPLHRIIRRRQQRRQRSLNRIQPADHHQRLARLFVTGFTRGHELAPACGVSRNVGRSV